MGETASCNSAECIWVMGLRPCSSTRKPDQKQILFHLFVYARSVLSGGQIESGPPVACFLNCVTAEGEIAHHRL